MVVLEIVSEVALLLYLLIKGVRTPSVATPKVTWVESSQWCAIGGSGLSWIDSRCMKAGGPNAGSPGKPA